jgi:molybdopterin adenylyltransferase
MPMSAVHHNKPGPVEDMAASVKQVPSLCGGTAESIGDPAIFGVVTISDRASAGIYDDLSGPAILQFIHEAIKSP